MAAALKRENPARTSAQVARILRASTGWAPSESTLLRLFHRLELMTPAPASGGEVFGRFEAEHPNDRWIGDALHGPKLFGRKTSLFAFIDDHSRLLTGYRFGYAEDAVRLGAALQPAVARRGIPSMLYVDNGSAYIDAWLRRACAKLGIRLIHSTPGRPQGRGKIERVFRTVRDQFLVEVADTTVEDLAAAGLDHAAALAELNRRFGAWVEVHYHRATHSETGCSPLERWDTGWDRRGRGPAMPAARDLTEAFLWSEHRVVTKVATVALHSNTYQVDPALVGRKVELVFSPFDLETIEVRHRDKSFGKALPHRISRHAHPKAKPEIGPVEPAPATGIDFLALTAETHERALRADPGIGFDALYGPDPTPPTGAGNKARTDPPDHDGQIPGQLAIDDTDGSAA